MNFWRIRESEYVLDPEAALESLWETLERNKIYPEDDQRNMRESTATGSGDPDPAREADETSSPPTPDVSVRPSKDASRYADLIDGPYVEWNTDVPLPDPKTAVMEDLIFGMIDIVETEGPLRKEVPHTNVCTILE